MEVLGDWELLAADIIIRSVDAYRILRYGDDGAAHRIDVQAACDLSKKLGFASPIEYLEDFFQSAWFETLCMDQDPDVLRKGIARRTDEIPSHPQVAKVRQPQKARGSSD